MMEMASRIIGLISEKDKESRITKCNRVFLEYAGLKSDDQVLGHTDEHFPWQEFAHIYRQHELNVLAGNSYSIIFPAKIANNEYRAFLHSKAAQYNQNNEIIGIQCHALEIMNPAMQRIIAHLTQLSPEGHTIFSIGKKNKITLSAREQDILFFITKAKTAKQIARILDLSPRAVYSHIENIKIKLNCHTKSELVDVAYQMGFAQELPNLDFLKELLQ